MVKIDNLTEREVGWILVAVEAVAALPSSGLPEDDVRHEEWKALVAKIKAQHPNVEYGRSK